MTYGHPYAPEPPKNKNNRKLVIALIFLACAVVLLCCAGIVSGLGGKDKATGVLTVPEATEQTFSSSTGAATVAASAAPKVKPTTVKPSPTVLLLPAGDYGVASKTDADALTIAPGTYKVATYGHCYWERVRDFTGDFTDIIANGNIDGKTVVRVVVKRTDGGLSLQGECLAARAK